MPHVRTDDAIRWSVGNPVVACGCTQDGLLLTGLQLDYSDDEGEWLEAIEGMADGYNPIPESGEVYGDDVYGYGGDIVIVRINHARSGDNPSSNPDKYIVKGQSQVNWIPGEQVHKGPKRWYGGKRYKCLVAHVTAAGIEPPTTPAYWQEMSK
jgi:hypothetical protein